MHFQFGEWILDVDIDATKAHNKILELQFNDVPSYRKYADTQCFRNYTAYCRIMPSEEKNFFDAMGITPEYNKVLGCRVDKECNYYVHGNYFVIGSFIRKPSDTIWSGKSDICIGKYQFTILHPEWLQPAILGNIPEKSVCIHFRAKNVPWLLNEESEQRYPEHPAGMGPKQKINNELQSVLKNIGSSFRELSEQEAKDYMRQWFERVVPFDKREYGKKRCFSSPIEKCYLWHALRFVSCDEEMQAVNMYDSLDHRDVVLFMNSERIGFVVENGQGLTSSIINGYRDIIVTDINFKWTYVHTHESMYGPYFKYIL